MVYLVNIENATLCRPFQFVAPPYCSQKTQTSPVSTNQPRHLLKGPTPPEKGWRTNFFVSHHNISAGFKSRGGILFLWSHSLVVLLYHPFPPPLYLRLAGNSGWTFCSSWFCTMSFTVGWRVLLGPVVLAFDCDKGASRRPLVLSRWFRVCCSVEGANESGYLCTAIKRDLNLLVFGLVNALFQMSTGPEWLRSQLRGLWPLCGDACHNSASLAETGGHRGDDEHGICDRPRLNM